MPIESHKALLSIVCITYNQEDFIRQTIDSFLMQKTNFLFEILIHDDASTDKTPEILKEYAAKDSRIKLILQNENQYSKGIRVWKNHCFPVVKSKYIALCEGDDYWTDSLKLQKQVDFLEQNKDYSLCFHCIQRYHQHTDFFEEEQEHIGTSELSDLLLKNVTYTNAVVFRNNFKLPNWYDEAPLGDWPLFALIATQGKFMKFKDVMGVYRIHQQGVWSKLNELKKINIDITILTLFLNNLTLSKVNQQLLKDNIKLANKRLRKHKRRAFKNKIKPIFGIKKSE